MGKLKVLPVAGTSAKFCQMCISQEKFTLLTQAGLPVWFVAGVKREIVKAGVFNRHTERLSDLKET